MRQRAHAPHGLKPRPLNTALIISLPFLVAGVILAHSAYNRYLSVEAAAEQIEFLKNLPQAMTGGDKLKMPAYNDNSFLAAGGLSGTVSCEYYNDSVSIRLIRAEVRRGFFSRTSVSCLVDARLKN
jgi:hypothetical protein